MASESHTGPLRSPAQGQDSARWQSPEGARLKVSLVGLLKNLWKGLQQGPKKIPKKAPRKALLLVLLAGLPLGLCACAGGEQAAGPQAIGPAMTGILSCPTPTLDFGVVQEGRVLEATFDLLVQSEGEFTLEGIRADCGCTATALWRAPAGDLGSLENYEPKMPLFPGDVLRLVVGYDTHNKGGQTRREITLYGDLEGGRAILALEADIRPWLTSEPRELIFGRMGRRETRSEHLRISSVGGEAFALSHERRAVPESLVVELTPLEPDAQGRAQAWDALVRLGPDMPEGVHQYPLYLTTDHRLGAPGELERGASDSDEDGRPLASTTPQVVVEVVGLFLAEPRTFRFSQVQASMTVARSIHLTCFDPSRLELPAGQMPKARLAFPKARDSADGSLTPAQEALLKTARVDVRANPAGGWDIQLLLEGLEAEVGKQFLALVIVETGHPDQATLELPVIGFRAPGG